MSIASSGKQLFNLYSRKRYLKNIKKKRAFHATSLYTLARSYERDSFFDAAAEFYYKASMLGHADSMCALAHLYSQGKGTISESLRGSDDSESTSPLNKMANNISDFTSQVSRKFKTKPNMQLASVWYHKGACLGHWESMYNIGLLYDAHHASVIKNPYIFSPQSLTTLNAHPLSQLNFQLPTLKALDSLISSRVQFHAPPYPISWAKFAVRVGKLPPSKYYTLKIHLIRNHLANAKNLDSDISLLFAQVLDIEPPQIHKQNILSKSKDPNLHLPQPKLSPDQFTDHDDQDDNPQHQVAAFDTDTHSLENNPFPLKDIVTLGDAWNVLDKVPNFDFQYAKKKWYSSLYSKTQKSANTILDFPWESKSLIYSKLQNAFFDIGKQQFASKIQLDTSSPVLEDPEFTNFFPILSNLTPNPEYIKATRSQSDPSKVWPTSVEDISMNIPLDLQQELDSLLEKYPFTTQKDRDEYDSTIIERDIVNLTPDEMNLEAFYWFYNLGLVSGRFEGLFALGQFFAHNRIPLLHSKSLLLPLDSFLSIIYFSLCRLTSGGENMTSLTQSSLGYSSLTKEIIGNFPFALYILAEISYSLSISLKGVYSEDTTTTDSAAIQDLIFLSRTMIYCHETTLISESTFFQSSSPDSKSINHVLIPRFVGPLQQTIDRLVDFHVGLDDSSTENLATFQILPVDPEIWPESTSVGDSAETSKTPFSTMGQSSFPHFYGSLLQTFYSISSDDPLMRNSVITGVDVDNPITQIALHGFEGDPTTGWKRNVNFDKPPNVSIHDISSSFSKVVSNILPKLDDITVEYFSRASQLGLPAATYSLAQYYASLGNIPEAIKYAEQAHSESHPESLPLLTSLKSKLKV